MIKKKITEQTNLINLLTKNKLKMNFNSQFKDLMICYSEDKLLINKKIVELLNKIINPSQHIAR